MKPVKCVCKEEPIWGKSPNTPYDWFVQCLNCEEVPVATAPNREEVLEEWQLNVSVIKKSSGTNCKDCFYYYRLEEKDTDDEDYSYCIHSDTDAIEVVLAATCPYFMTIEDGKLENRSW